MLTSFRQDDRIFWFFFRDEEFVSKTFNDSNIDLNKLPASKVRQLDKKMESSKATTKHIKQVVSDPQATLIQLMQHQCTELLPSKLQRKENKSLKAREDTNKQYYEDKQRERIPQAHRRFNNNHQTHAIQERYPSQRDRNQDRCKSPHMEGFRCPACRYQCKNCHKFIILVACATRRMDLKGPLNIDHPRHIDWRLLQLTQKILYAANQKVVQVMTHSVCKWKLSLLKLRPNYQHHNI